MSEEKRRGALYVPSEDVVAREIEGELILVPLTAEIANEGEELFTLNETGKAIWKKLDGRSQLEDIAKELAGQFAAPLSEIKKDIVGFVQELLRRKMIVSVKA